jgi:hypothetical protein
VKAAEAAEGEAGVEVRFDLRLLASARIALLTAGELASPAQCARASEPGPGGVVSARNELAVYAALRADAERRLAAAAEAAEELAAPAAAAAKAGGADAYRAQQAERVREDDAHVLRGCLVTLRRAVAALERAAAAGPGVSLAFEPPVYTQ